LRPSSREIVDGARPRRRAIDPIVSPPAVASAISSRSANVRQRPFRSRPRRGRTPPHAVTQREPCLRYEPICSAASLMNAPRCSAAQNSSKRLGVHPIGETTHRAHS
jgi:hypothetical protein